MDGDAEKMESPVMNRKINLIKKYQKQRKSMKGKKEEKLPSFYHPKIRYYGAKPITYPSIPSLFNPNIPSRTPEFKISPRSITGSIKQEDLRHLRKSTPTIKENDSEKFEESKESETSESSLDLKSKRSLKRKLDEWKEKRKIKIKDKIKKEKKQNLDTSGIRRVKTQRNKKKHPHILMKEEDRENRIPYHFFSWGFRMLIVNPKKKLNFGKNI